jgi:hypothetical protein
LKRTERAVRSGGRQFCMAPTLQASPRLFFQLFSAFRGVAERKAFMDIIQHSFAVGKYLVSPLIKDLDDGGFAASVSIRSGRGSGTHDRVMRFTPRFASRATAMRYAAREGLAWVRERTAPATARTYCAA